MSLSLVFFFFFLSFSSNMLYVPSGFSLVPELVYRVVGPLRSFLSLFIHCI